MYILGLGDHIHDPSICLLHNNKLVAAIELERLTRIKHNLAVNEAFYQIENMGRYFQGLRESLDPKQRENIYSQGIQYCLDIAEISLNDIELKVISGLYDDKVYESDAIYINHHLAHAASAYYSSPFEESAIFVIDGYGNKNEENSWETTSFFHGNNEKINIIDKLFGQFDIMKEETDKGIKNTLIVLKNSLGALYKNVTVLIGLGHFGEGKTMGLAAYGKLNKELLFLHEHFKLEKDGKYKINNRAIFEEMSLLINKKSRYQKPVALFQLYADIAFMTQSIAESIVIHCCKYLYKRTQSKFLCLAGGVALNSSVNGKLIESTSFEHIFIQPAAGDNGISIGCAYYGAHEVKKIARKKTSKFSPYTGKNYSKECLDALGDSYNLKKVKTTLTIEELAAQYIASGKVIGWFQGRSEIGPRALGNRSILADPRNPLMKIHINKNIKSRESFRPLAPSIIYEKLCEYFDTTTELPYMIITCKVKQKFKKMIPAVIHIDDTARVQSVKFEQNPIYYQLIKQFELITGIPIILNTSFNGPNEPIVETPEDAIKAFIRLKLDALFINDTCFVNTNESLYWYPISNEEKVSISSKSVY